MQRPTAVPRIPASASGVSTQRSGPNRSRSPAVARKTPPERPTSSPITSTESSRASSPCSASLTASTIESSAIAEDPPQLREVRPERRGRVDVGVLEEQRRVGRRLGLGGRDALAHQLRRLLADRLRELVVEDPGAPKVALVAADALALLLLLDPLEVNVRARIVGGGVGRRAVRDGLDERRPVTATRALHRLPRRLVDGEHVGAVDAHAGP